MKIQTSAEVRSLKSDGQDIALDQHHNIDLEFSAIDTGGGFKDPMLDFSISFEEPTEWSASQSKISLTLVDPNNEEKKVSFLFDGEVTAADRQINGRIKEDQLSREVIGFVLNLLR
jgi:hypothetical protein